MQNNQDEFFKIMNNYIAPTHKKYLLNQVDCILSLDSNNLDDYLKISELFTTYSRILSAETTPQFRNSLNESKIGILDSSWRGTQIYQSKLTALEKNNPQSFLIIPLNPKKHLISAVVRKTDAGFSATIVNASDNALCRGERGSYGSYKEYIFQEKNLVHLLSILDNSNLHRFYLNKLNCTNIYQQLEDFSDKKYILNAVSRDQKIGNCYVKEVEKAIKYASATADFSPRKFEDLRCEGNEKFKPKWPINTELVHKRYIEQLQKENPTQSHVLQKRFERYLQYKHYARKEQNHKMQYSGISDNFSGTDALNVNVSGKSVLSDRDGNIKAVVTWFADRICICRDKNNKIIGQGRKQNNRVDYIDNDNKNIGYSIRDDIGQKYYDANDRLIGIGRIYSEMKKTSDSLRIEHKGISHIEIMLGNLKKAHEYSIY